MIPAGRQQSIRRQHGIQLGDGMRVECGLPCRHWSKPISWMATPAQFADAIRDAERRCHRSRHPPWWETWEFHIILVGLIVIAVVVCGIIKASLAVEGMLDR